MGSFITEAMSEARTEAILEAMENHILPVTSFLPSLSSAESLCYDILPSIAETNILRFGPYFY